MPGLLTRTLLLLPLLALPACDTTETSYAPTPLQNPATYDSTGTLKPLPPLTGRYEAIRYPDGHIGTIWNPYAPSDEPPQGYWDVTTDPHGHPTRVWHPSANPPQP